MLQGDASTLNRLYAGDYVHTGPDGVLSGKSDRIAEFRSRARTFTYLKRDDVRIRMFRMAAVVTDVDTMHGRFAGKDISGRARALRVWVKQSKGWQLVAAHATALEQPSLGCHDLPRSGQSIIAPETANHVTASTAAYDPFGRGHFQVGFRTIYAGDTARERVFPCEIWYPARAQDAGIDLPPGAHNLVAPGFPDKLMDEAVVRDAPARPGTYPMIIFSHSSGGGRRQSTFLCTHLSSHGYVVAAPDHSELVAAELARGNGESSERRQARIDAWIASRVPDIRFLVDHLLGSEPLGEGVILDRTLVGIVGHSFGGWTALAAPDAEPLIKAVVALAPGGSSQRKPGMLPLTLTFAWGRDVPTLYLVAENDVSLPVAGMYELFERTPATKRMVILPRADHLHFMDNVEQLHEAARGMSFPAELAWLREEMRPIAELCSAASAHKFIRGLTLCHLDASLKGIDAAQRFFADDLQTALQALGIDAIVHTSQTM